MQKSRFEQVVAAHLTSPDERELLVPSYPSELLHDPLIAACRVTAIGWYPRKADHVCQRPYGIGDWVMKVVLEGRGWSEQLGQRRSYQRGDVMALAPQVPHRYGSDPREPWTIAWIHLQGTAVNPPPILPRLSARRLQRAAELIEEGMGVAGHAADLPRLRLLSGIGAHFLSVLQTQEAPSDPLGAVLARLTQDPTVAVSLSDLAKECQYSTSQFLVQFRKRTGTTPMDWLGRQRLSLACHLLSRTQQPISDIAAACGIPNANSFARAFRQHLGMSPSAYRRVVPTG